MKKSVEQAEKNLEEKGIPVNYLTLAREMGKDRAKDTAEEIATHEREKKQKGGGK